MCWEDQGQFTGEISPLMLKELGLDLVMIGHSERRHVFGETDVEENKKVKAALNHGFTTLLCIGETAEEKDFGISAEVLRTQLKVGFHDVPVSQVGKIWVAYEPVWAIGTGKTASADQAQEIHAFIRKTIADKYGKEVADNTSILYGGSCNAGNAKELFSNPDVDGGLIGGASLEADKFLPIIEAFN